MAVVWTNKGSRIPGLRFSPASCLDPGASCPSRLINRPVANQTRVQNISWSTRKSAGDLTMSPSKLTTVCSDFRKVWSKELPPEAWYLCVAVTCIASHKPTLIKDLFHVVDRDLKSDDNASRQIVSTRLKDAFMKTWTITGIPSVITAVSSLAAAEREAHPEDSQLSMRQQQQNSHYYPSQLDHTIEQKGYSFMQDIYRHNLDPIMSTWGNHQADFEWLEKRVIYGLFLSDHAILSPIETSIVTLSAMLCQPLKPPALWHIRGLRRLGVSKAAAASVIEAAAICARFCGKTTDDWIRVEDVEDEV